MRCQGQGDVLLAERAYDVHLLNLNNAGLSISGKNVLAFSSSLDWNIERVKGGSPDRQGLGRSAPGLVLRAGFSSSCSRRRAFRSRRSRAGGDRRHHSLSTRNLFALNTASRRSLLNSG
jgi:hypothetical protein